MPARCRRASWLFVACAPILIVGCAVPLLPAFSRPQVVAADDGPLAKPLWAQGSAAHGEDGLDRIWLVFDAPIDPSSVHAQRFAVVFADGGRAMPRTAHFGPADEAGELRSLVLDGEFRDADGRWAVEQVQIWGRLFAANGASLQGTDAAVREPQAPRVVSSMWVKLEADRAPDDCETSYALRTWWSDSIEPARVDRFTVGGASVSEVAAGEFVGLADLEPEPRPRDNVLDLCSPSRRSGDLRYVEGAVLGPTGLVAAAGESEPTGR